MNYRYRLPLHHLQEEKRRIRKRDEVKLDKKLLKNLKAAALLFPHRMECKLSPTEQRSSENKGPSSINHDKMHLSKPAIIVGHIMFTRLPHNDKIVTLGLNHNSHSYKIHIVHQPLLNTRIIISLSTFYC